MWRWRKKSTLRGSRRKTLLGEYTLLTGNGGPGAAEKFGK
jgi:hypothetical protein